jgi:predicted transcriptional regulator
MKQLISILVIMLMCLSSYGQEKVPYNIVYSYGVPFTKKINRGKISVYYNVDVPNQIVLNFNRTAYKCDSVYVKLTTATGRMVEYTNCDQYTLGRLKVNEFPAELEVRYKDADGELREFACKVVYPYWQYLINIVI